MTTSDQTNISHFVLRAPLRINVRNEKINTIEAHNDVVVRSGQVAVAKFGSAGTAKRVEMLRRQIERGVKTFLILVAKQGKTFVAYQAPLVEVHLGKATPAIAKITPAYYSRIEETPQLWFVVSQQFVPANLAKFRLSSNHRPLLDVIGECRTSAMLVEPTSH